MERELDRLPLRMSKRKRSAMPVRTSFLIPKNCYNNFKSYLSLEIENEGQCREEDFEIKKPIQFQVVFLHPQIHQKIIISKRHIRFSKTKIKMKLVPRIFHSASKESNSLMDRPSHNILCASASFFLFIAPSDDYPTRESTPIIQAQDEGKR